MPLRPITPGGYDDVGGAEAGEQGFTVGLLEPTGGFDAIYVQYAKRWHRLQCRVAGRWVRSRAKGRLATAVERTACGHSRSLRDPGTAAISLNQSCQARDGKGLGNAKRCAQG